MNKQFRKIIYWGGLLATYALTVVVVFRLLLATDLDPRPLSDAALIAAKHDGVSQLLELMEQPGDLSGILLPLGPDAGHLPGNHDLWHEFESVRQHDNVNDAKDGFDGLQAVEKVGDFLLGSVSELFLSGSPRQVFRRGHFLFVLNSKNDVQIIDCTDPREPKLTGHLSYASVKHMEMRGDIAYLLLERRGESIGRMIVVDLKQPGKPRELARLELPGGAYSFFFINDRLVVYTVHAGYKGDNRLYLYVLSDNFQLILQGSVESPNLGENFLLYDEYVLVPSSKNGLTVYDFSDPLNYVQTASLSSPDVNRLARYGEMVIAKGSGGRLHAIDFHDPLQPRISKVAEGGHFAYLLAYGNYTYFFTFNGYLRVFDLPLGPCNGIDEAAAVVDGELIALSPGAGFTLLGNAPVSLPTNITGVLPLPESLDIVDQLVWQGSLVLLDNVGVLHFYHVQDDSSLIFGQQLHLDAPQRWLAADEGYLYAGGESSVSIVADDGDDAVSVTGHIDLSGKATWDGLVTQNTLLLAAGKEGLLSYALASPGRPMAGSAWAAPRHLQSQVDVRQLAAVDDERVLFAAGPAGLFTGRMGADGEFRLEGTFRFPAPIRELAVHDGLALVPTGQAVSVVDIRDEYSMQALGEITFSGVEKLAVAAPDSWAGYTSSMGWSFFPLPRILLPGDANLLDEKSQISASAEGPYNYQLHLFNDQGVKTVPRFIPLSGNQADQAAEGGLLVH